MRDKDKAHVDASLNVTLNGVTVNDQQHADSLRIPTGERVAWAIAFPRKEHQ